MTTYAEWHEENNDLTDEEWDALGFFLANEHEDTDSEYDADTIGHFQESWQGCYGSMANYAEETTRDTCEIPDFLDYHIDWDSMARDFEYDYWEAGGHIFRNY